LADGSAIGLVLQIHAGVLTLGEIDPSGAVKPGTEAMVLYGPDRPSALFLLPAEAVSLRVESYHLPNRDMPETEKRCDTAPNRNALSVP
jgi:hypothetical protein